MSYVKLLCLVLKSKKLWSYIKEIKINRKKRIVDIKLYIPEEYEDVLKCLEEAI